jgi:hypothetical protein
VRAREGAHAFARRRRDAGHSKPRAAGTGRTVRTASGRRVLANLGPLSTRLSHDGRTLARLARRCARWALVSPATNRNSAGARAPWRMRCARRSGESAELRSRPSIPEARAAHGRLVESTSKRAPLPPIRPCDWRPSVAKRPVDCAAVHRRRARLRITCGQDQQDARDPGIHRRLSIDFRR